MAGFRGDSGSICQQFEGIVYLGLKQRLHDRWRGENLPCPRCRTPASTRKLLSADSFILVDIYQVNYPRSFQMFTTTSAASRRVHGVGARGGEGVLSSRTVHVSTLTSFLFCSALKLSAFTNDAEVSFDAADCGFDAAECCFDAAECCFDAVERSVDAAL